MSQENKESKQCKCPYCDKEINDTAEHCIFCRKKIIHCSICSYPITEGKNVCPNIGAQFPLHRAAADDVSIDEEICAPQLIAFFEGFLDVIRGESFFLQVGDGVIRKCEFHQLLSSLDLLLNQVVKFFSEGIKK